MRSKITLLCAFLGLASCISISLSLLPVQAGTLCNYLGCGESDEGRGKIPSPVPLPPVTIPKPLCEICSHNPPPDAGEIFKNGQETIKNIPGLGDYQLRASVDGTTGVFGSTTSNVIKAVVKGTSDVIETYRKSMDDTNEQAKRSFDDVIDAGKAAANYARRQLSSAQGTFDHAAEQAREGKYVDAIWTTAVQPMQEQDKNAFLATQESKVIKEGAQAAASYAGGPEGAAAFAAWSTYHTTGDVDAAFRAGIVSAVTSYGGEVVNGMPTGTVSEVIKKAAVAGALGGIAVAAAGGDADAVGKGFLASGGAVVVQGATDMAGKRIYEYSPKAGDAANAAQCMSARDYDCISKTTYARDAKGNIESRLNPKVVHAAKSVGKWSQFNFDGGDGPNRLVVLGLSKLPQRQAIPLFKNQAVLTWRFNANSLATIKYAEPAVVLTFIGKTPPFQFNIDRSVVAPAQPPEPWKNYQAFMGKWVQDYNQTTYPGPSCEIAIASGRSIKIDQIGTDGRTLVGTQKISKLRIAYVPNYNDTPEDQERQRRCNRRLTGDELDEGAAVDLEGTVVISKLPTGRFSMQFNLRSCRQGSTDPCTANHQRDALPPASEDVQSISSNILRVNGVDLDRRN